MLTALNEIGTTQANPTESTKDKCLCLLDYAGTYSKAFPCSYESNMQLHVDSDAVYLGLPKACSRIAGFYIFHTKASTDSSPLQKISTIPS
mmetsp:Transcript_16486/g.23441  ORF Transcript_16486/g.23441 Transcript_16486/m.23441 type:complete len:91 (+) Transcript_16486:556-828(+)